MNDNHNSGKMEFPDGPGVWEVKYFTPFPAKPWIATIISIRYRMDGFADGIPSYSDEMLKYLGPTQLQRFTELVENKLR